MTTPPYPPAAPAHGWSADPGAIPLRPLGVGDLLGLGFAVVRRHLALLGPLAIMIGAISVAAQLAVLWSTGTLALFASGEWLAAWQQGFAAGDFEALPTGLYVGVGVGSLISIFGAFVLSGAAASCVAADAVARRPQPSAISSRLIRGLPRLLGVAALLAIAVSAGSLVLFAPGLLAYAVWAVAAPVAVMEPSSSPLARSARLTRGFRWRILGVTALILLITGVIDAVIASFGVPVATALGARLSDLQALILTDAIATLLSAITTSWVGAVIALLYLDIRIRTENLAPALRAAAPRP